MTFDYGNLLTRAWQITWRHKILWALSAMPILVSMLFFAMVGLPVAFLGASGKLELFALNGALAGLIGFVVFIVYSIASIVISSYTMAAATLGVVRAERGEGSLLFRDLLRDGSKYFGRVLTVMLVMGLTAGMAFTIFFLIVFVLSFVTMGIASICMQPFILLMTPLSFLVMALMEGAQAAVVAEEMSAMDALKRAYQVVRENIWKYIFITLIVYFGSSILIGFSIMPLMVPFFALAFLAMPPSRMDPQIMALIPIGFTFLFFPAIIALQTLMLTFMKSALVITYLRLTSASGNQVIFNETQPA